MDGSGAELHHPPRQSGHRDILAHSFNTGGDTPYGFLEVVLVMVVLFFIGLETCTYRYWKRDK